MCVFGVCLGPHSTKVDLGSPHISDKNGIRPPATTVATLFGQRNMSATHFVFNLSSVTPSLVRPTSRSISGLIKYLIAGYSCVADCVRPIKMKIIFLLIVLFFNLWKEFDLKFRLWGEGVWRLQRPSIKS